MGRGNSSIASKWDMWGSDMGTSHTFHCRTNRYLTPEANKLKVRLSYNSLKCANLLWEKSLPAVLSKVVPLHWTKQQKCWEKTPKEGSHAEPNRRKSVHLLQHLTTLSNSPTDKRYVEVLGRNVKRSGGDDTFICQFRSFPFHEGSACLHSFLFFHLLAFPPTICPLEFQLWLAS